MKSRRAFYQIAAFAVAALSVFGLTRTGRAADEISQTRDVSGFERVRLDGAFRTEITAGAAGTHVVIRADRDIIDRVTTEVHERTLVVGMRSGANNVAQGPTLEITLPVLRGFANDGAGSTKIAGLSGGDLDIANAGAASIVASGHLRNETIALNGTGKIDTTAVDAHDVTVDNNGVGIVHVRASGLLTMSVNGVGEIRYTGNPTHVDSQVNGIGRIGRL